MNTVLLYEVVKEGDLKGAQEILETEFGMEYSIPLYKAVSKGHIEIVKLILTRVISYNGAISCNGVLIRALRKAVKEGHLEIVKLILGELPLNQSDELLSMVYGEVLFLGAKKGYCNVVQFVLHKQKTHGLISFDLELEDALIEASRKGHLKVVKILINRVDCSAALTMAARNGHWDVYMFIYEHGTFQGEDEDDYFRRVKRLHESYHGPNHQKITILEDDEVKYLFADYYTPIRQAISKGDLKVVKEMIAEGGVEFGPDFLFHEACFKGYLEILKVLINDFIIKGSLEDHYFSRMLVFAVKGNQRKVVKYLQGLNLQVDYEPALVKATERGNLEMVKLLSTPGLQCQRVIEIATRKGYDEVLSALKPKADIKSDSEDGPI